MLDERISALLDRKYDFVAKTQPDGLFMREAARFLEWLFAEDLLRPYALQLLQEDQEHRARFIKHREDALAKARELRVRLDQLYPNALQDERALERQPSHSITLTRFDEAVERPKESQEEEDDLERSPSTGDPTSVGELIRILCMKELALRGEDESTEKLDFMRDVEALRKLHEFRFKERQLRLMTSPGRSLRNLLAHIRAMNPPPPGVDDWMPFLSRNECRDAVLEWVRRKEGNRAARIEADSRVDLERVYQELHSVIGSSLSSLTVISRFKERCTWFDKDRMRRIAADDDKFGDIRENRLTMELARYLHDNGIFSLVRSRMANLEPDVIAPFGARRLAIESKVYDKDESARAVMRRGFWQLHAYLTSLETKTIHAHEGFLIVFRLGGAICDAPGLVVLNRFRIHIVPIDLGKEDSGHAQGKPSRVTAEDLIEAAASPTPP